MAGSFCSEAGNSMLTQGMVRMMVGIAKQEGAVGFFRGLGPTIVTNAPYSAFYYLFYTSLKERLQQVTYMPQLSSSPLQGRVSSQLLFLPLHAPWMSHPSPNAMQF